MTKMGTFFTCSVFLALGLMVTFWLAEKTEQVQLENQLHNNTFESKPEVENELWIRMYTGKKD